MTNGIRGNKIRAVVRFVGRVQGVFFRANTKKFAIRNDVGGWVMNCGDGSVMAVFEGDERRVERTIGQCLNEQPYADVSDHEVRKEEYKGEFGGFRVRYRGSC